MPQLTGIAWTMMGWTLLCAVVTVLWALSAPGVVIALMSAVYWMGMTALFATWLVMRPVEVVYVEMPIYQPSAFVELPAA